MDKKSIFAFIIASGLLTGCFVDKSELNVSCAGNECTEFNLTVSTGHNSSTPIANASVEIGWRSVGGIFISSSRIYATGRTNEQGKFRFKASPDLDILEKSGKHYAKVIVGNEYFDKEEFYYLKNLDTVINSNIHVPSKAKVNIKYKNFQPTSDDDFFSVTPYFSTYGSSIIPIQLDNVESSPSNNFFFDDTDPPFDELLLSAETAGNQYTHFSILIKSNGQRIEQKDSIFIEKGKTGMFEVDFDQ